MFWFALFACLFVISGWIFLPLRPLINKILVRGLVSLRLIIERLSVSIIWRTYKSELGGGGGAIFGILRNV